MTQNHIAGLVLILFVLFPTLIVENRAHGEPGPTLTEQVRFSFGPDPFQMQPYVAAYMTNSCLGDNPGREEPSASAARVTVTFAGTNKAVIQNDNALAAGIAAQGPHSHKPPYIDWGYVLLLVLDGPEDSPYIEGEVWECFEYGRNNLFPLEPPAFDLVSNWTWRYPGVLTVDSEVGLCMWWDTDKLNCNATIDGIEYYLYSYTPVQYETPLFMLGTCGREIGIPLPGTVKWLQFPGAWSVYSIGPSGWCSHLSYPSYLSGEIPSWKNVSFAYSVDGEESWLDNTCRWGTWPYRNVSAHYYCEPWSLPLSDPPNQVFFYPTNGEMLWPDTLFWAMYAVDLSVISVEPVEPHYSVVQVYHGEMRRNNQLISLNYTVTVGRIDDYTRPPSIFATIGFERKNLHNSSEITVIVAVDKSFAPGTFFTCNLNWIQTEDMTTGEWEIGAFIRITFPSSWPSYFYDGNPADNELYNGTVLAKEVPGDINGDALVDIFDAIAFAGAFGAATGSMNYNPDADFVAPIGLIDILDAIVIGGHFGWTIDTGSQDGGSGSGFLDGTYAMDGQGGNTIVSVEPAQLNVYKGETFTVSTKITDVMDIYGWEFKLYWNRTILNCTNAVVQTPSAWTNSTLDLGDGLEANYNSTHGCFWKALTAKNPATSFTGSLTMVTFTFQTNAEGTTSLLLQDIKLGNSTAQPISFSQTDGSVTVYCGRYMRGDTRSVNGLNVYVLNATQSASPQNYGNEVSGYQTVYWGFKAFVRRSNGVEVPITLDGQTSAPKAVVSRTSGGGIQSSTVSVTGTSLQSTDSLVVRVYMKFGSGAWSECASFTTEQLQASGLQTATWTVYYYTSAIRNRVDQTTTGTFYWGTTTYNSRIQNLKYG